MTIIYKKRGFGQTELWVDGVLKVRVGPTIGKWTKLGNYRVQFPATGEAVHTMSREGAMSQAERYVKEDING